MVLPVLGVIPPQPDRRILIWPEFEGILSPKNDVSTFIKQKFKQQLFLGGYPWRYVTETQRDFYWDQFAQYRWEPQHEKEIREIWKNLSAETYRRTMHRRQNTDNVPRTVDPAIWATYIAHWEEESWKKMATAYGNNRRSEPASPRTGISRHIAGSRPYAVHATASMRQELNRDPNSYELNLKTHSGRTGPFPMEEVERRIDEQFPLRHTGDAQHYPMPEDVNAIYFDVVGGVSHRRVYGIWSTAHTIYRDEMTPCPRGSSKMKPTTAAQNEAIQAARAEVEAAR
ncbi:uncharacterized protein [Henckelia pumila]|uniref:uncharacterized protein n=1 Tax=Henckelia pumila TaxID=405737 RepID=UPI003C6E0D5E